MYQMYKMQRCIFSVWHIAILRFSLTTAVDICLQAAAAILRWKCRFIKCGCKIQVFCAIQIFSKRKQFIYHTRIPVKFVAFHNCRRKLPSVLCFFLKPWWPNVLYEDISFLPILRASNCACCFAKIPNFGFAEIFVVAQTDYFYFSGGFVRKLVWSYECCILFCINFVK